MSQVDAKSQADGLRLEGLRAEVAGKEILHGVDLVVRPGEVHAIMGPNGSGKTTLASAVMGKPGYKVTGGRILVDGEDVTSLPTHERARKGLFMVSQYPAELPGVSFLDLAEQVLDREPAVVGSALLAEAERIGLKADLLGRSVNVGFSGGEKKRAETMQLALFGARYAVLDELDSGLDLDALRDVARRVAEMVRSTGIGVLAITHYSRLLQELKPDRVHVFAAGRVVRSGGPELAVELERTGYGEGAGEDGGAR